jgi:putative two-component system response regulator
MPKLPAPQGARPAVLVVDDDEAVAGAIAARLGPDFRVVGLADPALAVRRARDEQPGVILCDIDMPGMQGDEVAYALSQDPATAGIPLVYLSALVDAQEVPELGVFGEHPALSKSASTEALRDVIETALGLPGQ